MVHLIIIMDKRKHLEALFTSILTTTYSLIIIFVASFLCKSCLIFDMIEVHTFCKPIFISSNYPRDEQDGISIVKIQPKLSSYLIWTTNTPNTFLRFWPKTLSWLIWKVKDLEYIFKLSWSSWEEPQCHIFKEPRYRALQSHTLGTADQRCKW